MDIDDVIRELRARNEPVPIPTRLPSAEEVEAAELRLGIPFPAAFRHYLLKASDVACGVVEPVTITLPGSHTDLFKVVDRAWNDFGVPRNLLPFCEDNADFYCMNSDGEVVFWSHNGWPSQKWSNPADWTEQVWLNDLDGP
ncbi:MAG: hypothetical protein BGO49_13910 [Planctomycetales bacterium 71-10]|nr:MAG: hypothetical protein BGO49_13910 [Planctomycetales bacterium 71-10]